MIVHAIEQLKKKDIPLYYRNEYSGVGDLEFPKGERIRLPLEFSIEMKPTGEYVVEVKIKAELDYQLMPVIQALKDTIISLKKNGQLR